MKKYFLLTLLMFGMNVFLHSQAKLDQKKSDTFPLGIKSSSPAKPKLMALVVKVKGDRARYLTDQSGLTLQEGRLIPTKGTFLVPQKGEVTFRPMPGITTLIQEDSKVQMKGLQIVKYKDKVAKRRAFLYLNDGAVFSSIAKGNEKTITYEIQTPQAVIAAKGTRFWVSFRNGVGKVGVSNGLVAVRLTNKTTLTLKQGEFVDLQGIGNSLQASPVRGASLQESEMIESLIQSTASTEGARPPAVNPFAVNAENADELASGAGGSVVPGGLPSGAEVGAAANAGIAAGASVFTASPLSTTTNTNTNVSVPNTNNTSTNPVVSPVVP